MTVSSKVTDPQTLFRNIVQVLDRGLRTSTYKLATMTALIEFSTTRASISSSSALKVPIVDLARMVISQYGDQLRPFNGAVLRQSTQNGSRILEAVESIGAAAGGINHHLTLDEAARFAPGVYRQAVDGVGLCLAQQPLPRLQRVAGAVRSTPFLYDDGFLHDNVTRSELARHGNSIQLFPGVAYGLNLYAKELLRVIRAMWVDDVIRINRMSADERAEIKHHLFRSGLNEPPASSFDPSPAPEPEYEATEYERPDSSVLVFDDDLDEIAEHCEVMPTGCWSRPSNTPVSCRAPGDGRPPGELPKIELFRWAWLVANGYQGLKNTSSVLRIRRTCDCSTCCNPQHLYVTSPTGSALSKTAIENIARRLPGGRASATRRRSRLVLPDNVDAIRNHCTLDPSGCWIGPGAGPAACRASGDSRPDDELPMMAPHRWVWMVINGRSSNPLPASYFVRRRCRNDSCCRPGHLYLTTSQGEELTLEEAERPTQQEEPVLPPQQPAREPSKFAARLNKLFETHLGADGNPYSSEEVSAALQEDGLPVSKTLVERLRLGYGNPPSAQTIEALAYFFNVDSEYFFAGAHSAIVSEAVGIVEAPTSRPLLRSLDDKVQITISDLGQMVKALSDTISYLLERGDTDDQTAMNLLEFLSEIGGVIASPGDPRTVERPLLELLVAEWKTAAREETVQRLIGRLEQLLHNE